VINGTDSAAMRSVSIAMATDRARLDFGLAANSSIKSSRCRARAISINFLRIAPMTDREDAPAFFDPPETDRPRREQACPA